LKSKFFLKNWFKIPGDFKIVRNFVPIPEETGLNSESGGGGLRFVTEPKTLQKVFAGFCVTKEGGGHKKANFYVT
jgi:hypothetical protein